MSHLVPWHVRPQSLIRKMWEKPQKTWKNPYIHSVNLDNTQAVSRPWKGMIELKHVSWWFNLFRFNKSATKDRPNEPYTYTDTLVHSADSQIFKGKTSLEILWSNILIIQFDFIELLNLAKMLPETIFYYICKIPSKNSLFPWNILGMIISPTSKFLAPRKRTLGFPDGPGRPALANFTAMWPSPGGQKTCGWTTDV